MAKTYDFSNLSFLIVDDNTHMISILKTLLKGFGVKSIHDATDAADAFEEFRQAHIDVIILDYAMDTLDGVEFARLVRTAKDTPNPYVPIIMLTAYSERSRVIDARDSGITEFLRKPISAADLYSRIISVIERPRPFVRTGSYFGPDRRRKDSVGFTGSDRRGADDDEDAKETAELESQDDIDALFS